MTFLNPALAAIGLAAIAIPIIIHFFMRRRRRPVLWGAMRFLIEAYKRQRRRLLFEQLLLLLVRCAIVALLALAIGRLLIGNSEQLLGARTLYIAIDNSLTASASDGSGKSSLDRHKVRAGELVGELSSLAGDRAGLVLMGSPARSVIVAATSDFSRVLAAIDAITSSDGGADVRGALEAIDNAIDKGTDKDTDEIASVVILSDWRVGVLHGGDPEFPLASDGRQILALPPGDEPLENFTIQEVRPRRSILIAGSGGGAGQGGSGQASVSLSRSGSPSLARRTVGVELSLLREQGRVSLGSQDAVFEAGQTEASVAIPFSLVDVLAGKGTLVAKIQEFDAIEGDNVRRAGLEIRRELRVGVVAERSLASVSIRRFEPPDWMGVALEPSGGDRVGRQIVAEALLAGSIDRARLARYDAVMVTIPDRLSESAWRQLREFVDGGGLVFASPGGGVDAQNGLARMIEAFDLPWVLDLESRELDTPISIATPELASPSSGLVGLLLGEFEALAKPVSIDRILALRDARESEVVLRTVDGDPLLVAGRGAGSRGRVVLLLCAIDPAWTTLVTKPLMVPLMQEIVRQGVGDASMVEASVAGKAVRLDDPTASLEAITPDTSAIALGSGSVLSPRNAGVWRISNAQGVGDGLLIVNADADAGNTDVVTPERARGWLLRYADGVAWLDDMAAMRAGGELASDAGSSLSLSLFLAALVLALLETAMARLASHGEAGGAP